MDIWPNRGHTNGWMDEQTDKWKDGHMDRRPLEWMGGQTDGQLKNE